ncbi:MAG: RelA/SpoT domain-containing protein [Thermodesulfobacteriota bacterium]
MPRSPQKFDPVASFLAENFPGPDPEKAFKELVSQRTQDHGLFLDFSITWLKSLVRDYEKSCNGKEACKRFVCSLDDSNKMKSWYSIADKLVRELREKEDTPEYRLKYSLNNFHRTMTDLVRLRVVCSFLSDVYAFEKLLKNAYLSNPSHRVHFALRKQKDTIRLRPVERRSAHRSIKYLLISHEGPGVFLELQIMTTFQAAWDQKDHPLIYEKLRENPERAKKLFNKYEDELVHNMGGSLHVLDTLFDQIKRKLGKP